MNSAHQGDVPLLASCWNSLVRLAADVRGSAEPIAFCSLRIGDGEDVGLNTALDDRPGCLTINVALDPGIPAAALPANGCLLRLKNLVHISTVRSGGLPRDVGRLVRVYLPYCFSSIHARSRGRAFAVSHLAQSLDGRIATTSGDSRGIGSPGNFLHAHRMRALCEGVLIGSRTLRRDQPQLTVRLVSGPNPRRIVLGSTSQGVDSLTRSSPDPVLFIGIKEAKPIKGVDGVAVERNNGFIATRSVLEALFERGIHSVYIEGGSLTASRFLEENTIDVLQLHIAPMIVGSGVNSFSLPAAPEIADARRLESPLFFRVDDAVMLVAALRDQEEAEIRP